MNKCLNCGKEIPEGRKFCSSSCSAKYNNVRRQRKPWTEEQRQRVTKPKKQRYCKYCGRESIGCVCEECRPFVGEIRLYEKLHLEGKTLAEKARQFRTNLIQMYVQEKKSLPDIYRETGIWGKTAWAILADAGIKMRGKQESKDLAISQGHYGITRSHSGSKITWDGKTVHYRSSYELRYAEELDRRKIRYCTEPFRVGYFDSSRKKFRTAIPDFYLPDTNELVEIKSTWTYDEQNMRDKFKAYRKAGYFPKLILEGKKINL